MEKICVAVRVRPPVSSEPSNGTYWKVEDNRISLHKVHGTPISALSYAFDHVFDESCTNARVYELLTKDIIHAAVEGFNGTAFAYGQTSSGKTFTMNGSETDPGIIHRAVKDIFAKIQMISDREFLIRVSYMEIYNEEINDLFAVENQKLQIHESLERGIFVAGLREEIVSNAEQVLELIDSGEVNRHFGETNMNVRSSRSHTIFRMVIESKAKDTDSVGDHLSTDAIRVAVLNLVDLAGSERIAKTGAGGVRLKEGKHINKSLMVLGNVINKLSDGAKQRGHIPYRDSKLTRILQPALGGNAKTSIICTLAPEEVHIEETKGTLQFASRAKRITNCVQVNEILTDAALLKRQKLEIEELRKKLQGSHAEVLEQVILKLRNDLLKYELEREKLQMELEEERKSHRERDQCIQEQQMKIVDLSNPLTSSDFNPNSGQDSERQSLKEECNDSNIICHGDAFRTPCFKAAPKAFVVKRSDYSMLPDYSPLPDTFSNVADEDTWLKMNKGYIADLDSLQLTPARKVQSFPSSDATPPSLINIPTTHGCEDFEQTSLWLKTYSSKNHKQEVQHLKRQLLIATEERNELERKHAEQILLNHQLMDEISKIQQEAKLTQEIPKRLGESVECCKDIYEDVLSIIQSFVSDEESSTSKLVSSTSEIGITLFKTLETHFSMAMDDHSSFTGNNSLIQEQCKVLYEKLNSTITSLVLSQTPTVENEQLRPKRCSCENKGCTQDEETACWEEELSNELNTIKERYDSLEKELDFNNQLLVVSKERYDSLETEFQLLKEDRDHLHQMVSESSRKLALVADQKENVLKDLNTEVQRRKNLEEEIKQFSAAFASRQRSVVSFQNDVKSKCEKLRAQYLVSVPKSLGC
ncbi:kinesin-like protein KIN-7N isoform X2 [Juglans microcarpa x Juglans regia]|uniref:kinesin-like protein KIN-7N isoform X2 n=1 Tax=Juglans microcarpa x Juglans regia TaxID=2249226 RepID=UPI001B7EF129|nr:kinesin-like protein KIN-7N isoform X2 [Juglans microcarpa x Juglans regia]